MPESTPFPSVFAVFSCGGLSDFSKRNHEKTFTTPGYCPCSSGQHLWILSGCSDRGFTTDPGLSLSSPTKLYVWQQSYWETPHWFQSSHAVSIIKIKAPVAFDASLINLFCVPTGSWCIQIDGPFLLLYIPFKDEGYVTWWRLLVVQTSYVFRSS